MAREADWAQISLPSGEIRRIPAACRATIGAVGNPDHMNIVLGKAGRNRWMGRRPHVRGTAMNPIDHPHGGGEGRTKGGRHPVSPTGKLAKGGGTRKRRKPSNKAIVRRRRVAALRPAEDSITKYAARLQPQSTRLNAADRSNDMRRSLKKGPFVDPKLLPEGRAAGCDGHQGADQDLGPGLHDRAGVRRPHVHGSQRQACT